MNIYVSSLTFKCKTVEEIILAAQANQLRVEFSSGLPYREDMAKIFETAPINRLAHNYFPAPKNSFVINLASDDEEIRKKSIAHCLQGLQLTKRVGAKFFAAHAGFCIDPNPQELGTPITYNSIKDKAIYWNHFIDSLAVVLEAAQRLNLDFYIENNVLAGFNFINRINPFFCCDSEEILRVMEVFSDFSNFGLLLDTAHLKVSCNTLDLDLHAVLRKIHPVVRAVHHSDNDGITDSNNPIDIGYWFLPYIKNYANLPHVLEVKKQSILSILAQINILEENGN